MRALPTLLIACFAGLSLLAPPPAVAAEPVASLPGSRRSISSSTRPPVALVPNSRAGMTRVSLNTSRSPGCSSDGRSRTPMSANSPLESAASPGGTSSRRLAERSGSGACAISSSGSS